MERSKRLDDSLRRTLREYYANPEYIQAAVGHAVASRPKRLPILADYLEPDGLAIEIGCGAGVYSDLAKQYVGLDISLEALRELKAKGRWAVCCDVAKMPIKDGVATTVLSFDTLEHVYVSRIDAYAVYRFFRSQGFESVNERSNPVMRLLNPWMRHRNWVVVEKRRTTA